MKNTESNKELSTLESFAKADCEYYIHKLNTLGYDCTLYFKEEKAHNTISFYFNDRPQHFTDTYQEMDTFLSGIYAGINLARFYSIGA